MINTPEAAQRKLRVVLVDRVVELSKQAGALAMQNAPWLRVGSVYRGSRGTPSHAVSVW